MATCTFFGHRDCPDTIKPKLKEVLIELITEQNVNAFYVGNHGRFDVLVRSLLRELKKEYPHINYAVVLAYFPKENIIGEDYSDTIIPGGIENVPLRFAISYRNNWMLNQSEYMLTYITRPYGGAYQFVKKAANQNKNVINIAEQKDTW